MFKGSGIALDAAGVVSEVSGEVRAFSPGRNGLPYGLAGDVFVQPGIVRSSLRQIAMAASSSVGTEASGTGTAPGSSLLDQVDLALRVRTLDNLVADSNELKLSIAGDVTLTGTISAPGASGALTVTDEGELFFGSSPEFEAHLEQIEETLSPTTKVELLRVKHLRNPDAVCMHLLSEFIDRI